MLSLLLQIFGSMFSLLLYAFFLFVTDFAYRTVFRLRTGQHGTQRRPCGYGEGPYHERLLPKQVVIGILHSVGARSGVFHGLTTGIAETVFHITGTFGEVLLLVLCALGNIARSGGHLFSGVSGGLGRISAR